MKADLPPTPLPVDAALHEELRERERALFEVHGTGAAPIIATDRKARWKAFLADHTELGAVTAWAERMAQRFGPTVQVWATPKLDWITALYIVRYGEAESYWPAQLSLDDLRRALDWERGIRAYPFVVVGEP